MANIGTHIFEDLVCVAFLKTQEVNGTDLLLWFSISHRGMRDACMCVCVRVRISVQLVNTIAYEHYRFKTILLFQLPAVPFRNLPIL